MSYARQLLDTYPRNFNIDANVLSAAIDALNDCAQACTADTTADLSERNLDELVKCIRLCLDCTDICAATVAVVSREAEYDGSVMKRLLQSCVAICESCRDECEHDAQMYAHWRVCAEPCR